MIERDRFQAFERACQNRRRSYSPYSGYPVGAVVITSDGREFDGCSVENGSFGLTVCAERAALSAAVLAGFSRDSGPQIAQVVIAGPDGASCSPCGACRQWIAELAPHASVSFWWDGELCTVAARSLMSYAFEYIAD